MNPQPSKPPRRLAAKGWVVVLPTLIILALALLLTQTTSAAPSPSHPRVTSDQLTFQAQQPLCQSCHPNEYNVWKNSTHAQATLDPVFQEQLAKSQNQDACLKCHTTGFDTGSGKFMSEGVTCEACHGAYKEGHPAGQTMALPIDAGTCRMCHEAAFSEWEKSQHAAQNIKCFDCHQAHTQGVRTGSAETLCAACHNDEQTKLTHSVHGISGVDCVSCHMPKGMTDTASTSGMSISASSHSFTVPADVCNRCHSSTTHPAGNLLITAPQTGVTGATDAKQQTTTARVKELESEVTDLEARANSLRNVAVISMGLALGVGAFFGLLVGVVGMSLWHARSRREAK
jgi:predicted CXXCH cytochrome family protein